MYIITVYGWEDRAATRIQIGCQEMAMQTKSVITRLGYNTDMTVGPKPDRSDAEVERAKRLMDRVGPIMLNLN